MLELKFSELYLEDLKEDIILNMYPIYDFLGKDLEKAFWFGFVFLEVLEKLQGMQPFLYSKPLRHIVEDILPYKEQFMFWENKYWKGVEDEKVSIFDIYSYILNNLFYENELDSIKIAIRFGELAYKQYENEKERKETHSS